MLVLLIMMDGYRSSRMMLIVPKVITMILNMTGVIVVGLRSPSVTFLQLVNMQIMLQFGEAAVHS